MRNLYCQTLLTGQYRSPWLIDIEVEDGIVKKVHFTGGCNGNTQGVSKLVEGMKVQDVIDRLEGIDCNGRGTSCPAQLAEALKSAL